LSGNVFVVVFKATNSHVIAGLFSGAILILSYLLWFGYSLLWRNQRHRY
jgi:hypothetical protein